MFESSPGNLAEDMQRQRNRTEIESAFAALEKGESGSNPHLIVEERQEDDMESLYCIIEAVLRRCVPDDLDDPILKETMEEWMKTLEDGEGVPAKIVVRDPEVIQEAVDSIQKKMDEEEQARLVSENEAEEKRNVADMNLKNAVLTAEFVSMSLGHDRWWRTEVENWYSR